jgi:hypothetical protein
MEVVNCDIENPEYNRRTSHIVMTCCLMLVQADENHTWIDVLCSSIFHYAFIGITEECIYKGFIVIKSCLIMISI